MEQPRRFRSGDTQEHFEHGPIGLVVDIHGPAENRNLGFDRGFVRFGQILDELVEDLTLLQTNASRAHALTGSIAHYMNAAALSVAEAGYVTPMIAVAGAVADEVCRVIKSDSELTQVVVNNGGDIAFSLSDGEQLRVGVVSNPLEPALLGRATVSAESRIRGVATSGRHGRSLSMGIADSVSVFAASAAIADAAATVIANAVMVESDQVVQQPAVELDASSDLGQRLVTVEVGSLSDAQIQEALAAGQIVADTLLEAGTIEGAVLCLSGQSCAVSEQNLLQLEP
ncbi:MAG: UPF0280 family protein [Acidimicrobiales bacterium]